VGRAELPVLGPVTVKNEPGFVFFFVQKIKKWKLAQKKIEKVFFFLWAKFIKLN